MKRYYLQLAVAIIGVISFFALLGVIGDYDYTEQVILSMSQEEYDSVSQELSLLNGYTPSEREIAHWWAEHQK